MTEFALKTIRREGMDMADDRDNLRIENYELIQRVAKTELNSLSEEEASCRTELEEALASIEFLKDFMRQTIKQGTDVSSLMTEENRVKLTKAEQAEEVILGNG